MLSIALVTLGDPGTLTGGYLYHRRMADLASRHGARIDFFSFPDRPFPLPALSASAVLRRIRQARSDVIVLDSIAAAYLGPALRLATPAVPVVGMLHQPPGGIDHGPLRTAAQAVLDRRAYTACRHLLVASESLADQLIAAGMPPHRIQVVPPGRDPAAGEWKPAGDLRHGRSAAFLCVANWVERKGLHDLLDAFVRLPDGVATLHLAGDTREGSAYAERLRARLQRSDLAERVVVHGSLPVTRVAALYAAADAFVLPSYKEPYGTVYGEAMAAGLPVVGWRAGNLPYLARDGQEGLVVTPGDLEGLTAALALLARDEALRRKLGGAARARALNFPTWEQSATLFFSALRSVVDTLR